jgi:hypothetical protein
MVIIQHLLSKSSKTAIVRSSESLDADAILPPGWYLTESADLFHSNFTSGLIDFALQKRPKSLQGGQDIDRESDGAEPQGHTARA